MAATKSRYAQKLESGMQMYGPGCCAHKLSAGQIQAAKVDAHARGHFRTPMLFDDRPRYAGRFLRMASRQREPEYMDGY